MWIPVTETLINSTHFKMNTYFMTKNIDIYEKKEIDYKDTKFGWE